MRESCPGALDLAAETRYDAADKLDARLQCRAHSLRTCSVTVLLLLPLKILFFPLADAKNQ
jgi:hypothetical protein